MCRDFHLIQILDGKLFTTGESWTKNRHLPSCSDRPVEEFPNASTSALQRPSPPVSRRGTLALGTWCPIPRRAPTFHRVVPGSAATLCTSLEEAGEVSRKNQGKSGVTGGKHAVLDDHQVRNRTYPEKDVRWRCGTAGCGILAYGRRSAKCEELGIGSTAQLEKRRKRKLASIALAPPSRKCHDGQAEHLRWKTGSLPTSSRGEASSTYTSRENRTKKGRRRNAAVFSGIRYG